MKVYLSSTLNDLGPERQAVKEALGGECTVVESYTADERPVRESCWADVEGCDLYIGIIGLRYGFIPPGEKCSITELEYDKARERKIRTLVFVKDADEIKSKFHDAVTGENPRELIETFRRRVTSGAEDAARGALFKSPEDLKAHVLKAYLRLSLRQDGPKPKPIEGRPYPGLRAFLPAEADRFFGRDAEIEALLERLLARGERFLALMGASGSGKSSLVYAGLIPKLTASPVASGARWFPVTFSPRELGDDPFQPLAAALKESFPDRGWRVPDLVQRLRDSPAEIASVAKQALGEDGSSAQLLLFVDQFEEVFAGKVDAAARAAFFELLVAAVACPLLRMVIAMRADFYAQWPQDEGSIALLRSGHFPVAVPGQAALKEMIIGPARAAGLSFKPPRLVQRILDETGTAPGALALAEFALAQLYDKRQDDELTETAYEAFGGVAGAIDGLAEDAVERAGAAQDEEALSHLFVAIASVEERGQELAVVRRRAAKSDLPGAALTLAECLVDKRLLVSSGGASDQAAVFEVGHEAIFTHWKRFNSWIEVYSEDLVLRRQSERAAAEWEKGRRAREMRWGWERQKPALEALRKLNHLPHPPLDADVADPGIAMWRILEAQLPAEPPLRSFLYPEPLQLLEELNSDATPQHRREEIGLRLNQLGDRRRGVGLNDAGLPDIMWIDIPGGEVTLETDSQDWFLVKPFQLARYPVTWSQYRAFLDAKDGYSNEAWWEGRPRQEKPGALSSSPSYPAINISWYDALAYCRWLSAKLNLNIRLPTEWEWQWAAAGSKRQVYPWSNEWNVARANTDEAGIGRTVAVGLYPLGRSPFGIDDMAGNVWQWCLNSYAEPSNVTLETNSSPVRRGGSWDLDPGSCRTSHRDSLGSPLSDRYHLGFRLCCGSPIPKTLGIEEHRTSSRDRPHMAVKARDGLRFDWDLFISYAHIDNQPRLPEEEGWISRFHATLETLLSMRLGRAAKIWRDNKLPGSDVFTTEIGDQFTQTAVLVSVLTPSYLNSDWCTREVREFCERAEQSGGMVVENKARIFKVLKLPVDTQESLPAVLKDVLGYEFFTVEDGMPLELDPAYGEKFAQDYNRKVGKLAWDVAQLLKKLEVGSGSIDKSGDAHTTAKATIYLAECSDDRKETREILEDDLRRHGYTVLPEQQLPQDEADYVVAVERLLARCQLAVHLVGASYGTVPDGPSQKSVVVLQNELAVQRSKSGALPRVIWLPEGTSSEEPPQQAFIEALRRDAEVQFGADLITGRLEELTAEIHAGLKKIKQPESKKPEIHAGRERSRRDAMSPATANPQMNPFPGLRPFMEAEEHLFFGRETRIDAMVKKLADTRFLAVVGPSGSGKSSLVRCGLLPALRRGFMGRAGAWRIALLRPGPDPIRHMAYALAHDSLLLRENVAGQSPREFIDTTLRQGKLGLIDVYEQTQVDKDVNLLVVVEQFEELFRFRQLGAGQQENVYGVSEEATAFVNLLLEVKEHATCPIFVVLTMRSDFLGNCIQFPGLAEAISAGQYLVPPMTREERRAAITGPARVGGAEISPVLITRLVNDVGDNPDQLSILQHALNRTWARWQAEGGGQGPLSLAHYEAIGTMAHALNHHAEEAFGELGSHRERQICEKVFKALTDKTTDQRGARRPTTLGTLCAVADATAAEIAQVISVFREPTRSFLMPPLADALSEATVIDISHESLMRGWQRLQVWADEEAQSAQIYRRLAETTALYEKAQAGLWRDPDLKLALDWRDRSQPNETWASRYHPGFSAAMAFLTESSEASSPRSNIISWMSRKLNLR